MEPTNQESRTSFPWLRIYVVVLIARERKLLFPLHAAAADNNDDGTILRQERDFEVTSYRLGTRLRAEGASQPSRPKPERGRESTLRLLGHCRACGSFVVLGA